MIVCTPRPQNGNIIPSVFMPNGGLGSASPSHLETHEHASSCAPMAFSLERIAVILVAIRNLMIIAMLEASVIATAFMVLR